jgi:hypothetical protein
MAGGRAGVKDDLGDCPAAKPKNIAEAAKARSTCPLSIIFINVE